MIRRWLLITGAAMFFSGCSLQNSLLYYPDPDLPSEQSLKIEGLMPWPSLLENYRALLFEDRKNPATKGTVLVFHGNAGRAADRIYYGPELSALGFRVLLAEYPGYGGRKGSVGEKYFVEDGLETLKQVSEQYGGPVYLLGESLGCGVAAAVARVSPVPVDGIILITPWDTLKAVASEKFPLLPVSFFLTDSYDTVQNLQDFKGPVVVAGAGEDEVIGFSHAENLYASLPARTRKMWKKMEGAGHNNWLNYTDSEWWKEIMSFASSGK